MYYTLMNAPEDGREGRLKTYESTRRGRNLCRVQLVQLPAEKWMLVAWLWLCVKHLLRKSIRQSRKLRQTHKQSLVCKLSPRL